MGAMTALEVRDLVTAGRRDAAAEALREPLAEVSGRSIDSVTITSDAYSLNSVSGEVTFADGPSCFFKFHAEEGESRHVSEYYRANILREAGLPVDVPIAMSSEPGRQLVLYRMRQDRRMVDVCRDLELRLGDSAFLPEDLLRARRHLDALIGRTAIESLRMADGDAGATATIHQLFSHRMHDEHGAFPGGRLARWYLADPQWDALAESTWVVDGVEYAETLAQLVERARADVDPVMLGAHALVTAHGDDHQGNLWVEQSNGDIRLVMFDPAFAGRDIPALLAFIKPTFHNVFAHPAWLYEPEDAQFGRTSVHVAGGVVRVETLPLSPMRAEILASIVEEAWIPLLCAMVGRGLLQRDWRRVIRSALMLCPLLVTNLLHESRPPHVRALGLANVVRMGAEPRGGTDALTAALDQMEEAVMAR